MTEWYDYCQIATLILFSLLVLGRALHLLITLHVNPIRIGKGENRLHKVVEVGLSLGLVLWVAVVVSFALHLDERVLLPFANTRLLDCQFARSIGATLLATSLIVFILALVSFGNSWRVGIDEENPGDLVSRGIFAFTRNPIFLSLIIYASGTFLLFGRLILLIFLGFIVAAVQYQIVQEEQFLRDRYGKSYEDYRSRTGRYVTLRRSSRV
jgi:protein-S-isoprenylcysteine O-methyltransferase Ste14